MHLKEDILQFIWSILKGSSLPLRTTLGLPIEILNPGFLNNYEGPDFKEAKIKIGSQVWAGSIEVHIESKDWYRHGHEIDANYENVILHVVYFNNGDVKLQDESIIPILELKEIISEKQLEVYRSLMYNQLQIPCQEMLYQVSPIHLSMMLQRACVERMEQKTLNLQTALNTLDHDWNTLFYYQLASNFGFKTNSPAFLGLAKTLPLELLARHKEDLTSILALCFGQAGLLTGKPTDDYTARLSQEFQFLKKKYALKTATSLPWKFTQTRPANFPTIRIAQFAQLVYKSSHLFSKILSISDVPKLMSLFETKADEYWEFHYHFGKVRKEKTRVNLGTDSKHLLIINTVCQTLFAYGHYTNESIYKERGLTILQHLPAESNRIIKQFKDLGFSIKDASESQGAIGLRKLFCEKRACIQCQIGKKLML